MSKQKKQARIDNLERKLAKERKTHMQVCLKYEKTIRNLERQRDEEREERNKMLHGSTLYGYSFKTWADVASIASKMDVHLKDVIAAYQTRAVKDLHFWVRLDDETITKVVERVAYCALGGWTQQKAMRVALEDLRDGSLRGDAENG